MVYREAQPAQLPFSRRDVASRAALLEHRGGLLELRDSLLRLTESRQRAAREQARKAHHHTGANLVRVLGRRERASRGEARVAGVESYRGSCQLCPGSRKA